MDDIIKRINELRDEYIKKFDEQFPMFLVMHLNDEQIIETMEKCIAENKPYNPKLKKDALY